MDTLKPRQVDDRSRITLGKLVEPGEWFRAIKAPNGTITLHPLDVEDRSGE